MRERAALRTLPNRTGFTWVDSVIEVLDVVGFMRAPLPLAVGALAQPTVFAGNQHCVFELKDGHGFSPFWKSSEVSPLMVVPSATAIMRVRAMIDGLAVNASASKPFGLRDLGKRQRRSG